MYSDHNQLQKHREISDAISILFRHLDFSLGALERIVFLRLLLRFGFKRILKGELIEIASQIDIHHLKLRKSINVLLEKGVLCEISHDQLRVSTTLLSVINFQSYNQKISRVSLQHLVKNRRSQSGLLQQLLNLLFQTRISHKQKKVSSLLKLNYQQWLVLFNLVWLSDHQGIVFKASTHELVNRTGMNRDALLRAITGLFEFGILRSKLNGTLNNNLLQSVSAIYFLNLSHPIWGNHRVYAHYYIVQFPLDYVPVIDRAYELMDLLVDHEQPLAAERINTCISEEVHEFSFDTDRRAYTFFRSKMGYEICEINLQAYSAFNKDFIQFLSLIQPDFGKNNSSLNTQSANLQRIKFLLHYCMCSHYDLVRYDSVFSDFIPSPSLIAWFYQYLKPSRPLQLTAQELELVKHTQSRVLFAITQAIFRSEKMHLLDIYAETTLVHRQSSACRKIILLGQSEITDHQVYFAPNKELTQDLFYKVEFIPVDGFSPYNRYYKREYQSLNIEEDFDQQKSYGLFDPRFQTIDIGGGNFS